MQAGAVSLVLVQPGGPPAAWSGVQLFAWVRSAVERRHQDVYFRPLLEAPSLGALAFRFARLRWLFAVEDRTFNAWLHLLWLKRPSERWTREQLEETYAYFQSRLSEGRFSEETCTNIDYVLYTGIRTALALVERGVVLTEAPSPRLLLGLVNTVTRLDLQAGALALAVEEPSLVKNPLVLRDLARSAVKDADAYVAALCELGIVLA